MPVLIFVTGPVRLFKTVALPDALHPLRSFTVTLKVPAGKLVAVAVVCTGDEFHEYEYVPDPPLTTVAVAVPFTQAVSLVEDVEICSAHGAAQASVD